MATFAEMIYQGAQQDLAQPTAAAGAMQGLASGIELASKVEEINARKAQLELQKQQMQEKKQEQMFKYLELGFSDKMPQRARKAYFQNFFTKQAETLGVPVDPLALDIIVGQMETNPEMGKMINEVWTGLQNGKVDPQQIQGILQSAESADKGMDFVHKLYDVTARMKQAQAQMYETRVQNDAKIEGQLADDLSKAATQIKADKYTLSTARSLLQSNLDSIASGKPVNPAAFIKGVKMFVKLNEAGIVTENETNQIKELEGIIGKGETFISKWLTGEISKKKVNRVLEAVNVAGANLDKNSTELANEFELRLKGNPALRGREKEFAQRLGVNELRKPTTPPKEKQKEEPPKKPILPGILDNIRSKLKDIPVEKHEKYFQQIYDSWSKQHPELTPEEIKRQLGYGKSNK